MKILILFGIFVGTFANATVLLVPQEAAEYQWYKSHCESGDYVCTNDYFTEVLAKKATPLFDELMDHIDLSSSSYSEEVRGRILHILEVEILTDRQLSMLTALLHQLQPPRPILLFKLIEKELVRILQALQAQPQSSDESFAFIFKHRVPLSAAYKFRTELVHIPIYYFSWSSLPVKGDSHKISPPVFLPLAKGSCFGAQLSMPITKIPWVFLQNEYCDPLGKISSQIAGTVSENRNWLWLAGLSASAVFLLSNYELSFNF